MSQINSDKMFAGSIPAIYESHLVPLIFQFYAQDLATRVAARPVSNLLEIAAGTGVLTRALATALPAGVSIIATDLNPTMLEIAAQRGTGQAVQWHQADAMRLPFNDATFDTVVCQFGAMFFPDRAVAFSEVKRVLKPGGRFIFSTWDRIEENEFAHTVLLHLEQVFPDDPPRFMAHTPHGYYDLAQITRDVQGGGFLHEARLETLTGRSRAASAREVAIAYCQGTPMRNEIEARDQARLEQVTQSAEAALSRKFGAGPVDGKIQAHIVAVEK